MTREINLLKILVSVPPT